MSRYRRVWVPDATYFFTVNLLERRRTLLVDGVGALREAFRVARAARAFDILAIVVLPAMRIMNMRQKYEQPSL